MIPATVPIEVRRNSDYAEEFDFADASGAGVDLSSYVFALQVRDYGDAAGSPRITLAQVTDPMAEGICLLTDKPGALQITISAATLETLPGLPSDGTEANDSTSFEYDLRSTLGARTDVWMAGTFTVDPGVTR